MTTVTDPSWLDGETSRRPLTVLVFFRGHWCPFCQAYLRELGGSFLDRVRGRGGELLAVTSESDELAQQAHRQWSLPYAVFSSPGNELAERFAVAITPKEQTPLASSPTEYPRGMAQPAVIALDREGRVLFRWAIDPSTMNLGGASDRPLPDDLWGVIEAALDGQIRALPDGRRLDPEFLAEHYPSAYATFQAWVAQAEAASS